MHVHPLTGFARSWKQCCMVPSFICYLKKHFTFTVRFLKLTKTRKLFRDILLHPETGLNVVIVTHPVTLERFVVLNNPSCDVSMFLNHFTQEFLSGDENADQLRLDQETVSALLKTMDTEYDRSILRAISALLHREFDQWSRVAGPKSRSRVQCRGRRKWFWGRGNWVKTTDMNTI